MANEHLYQLVLQFPCESINDYDALIALESEFMEAIGERAIMDGHDSGQGEFNIFVFTDAPEKSLAQLKPALIASKRLAAVRVGVREFGKKEHRILWPEGDQIPFAIA